MYPACLKGSLDMPATSMRFAHLVLANWRLDCSAGRKGRIPRCWSDRSAVDDTQFSMRGRGPGTRTIEGTPQTGEHAAGLSNQNEPAYPVERPPYGFERPLGASIRRFDRLAWVGERGSSFQMRCLGAASDPERPVVPNSHRTTFEIFPLCHVKLRQSRKQYPPRR